MKDNGRRTTFNENVGWLGESTAQCGNVVDGLVSGVDGKGTLHAIADQTTEATEIIVLGLHGQYQKGANDGNL